MKAESEERFKEAEKIIAREHSVKEWEERLKRDTIAWEKAAEERDRKSFEREQERKQSHTELVQALMKRKLHLKHESGHRNQAKNITMPK